MVMKASSLIESLISLTIISIIIVVSMLIFSNILNSRYNISYFQALNRIEKIKTLNEKDKIFEKKNYKFKEYIIKQEVIPYRDNTNLLELKYIIYKGKENIKECYYLVRKR